MPRINNHNILLLTVLSIIFFGFLLMYSASSSIASYKYNRVDYFFFFRQSIWLLIGISLLVYLSFFDYKVLQKKSLWILFLSWILVLIPILFTDDSVSRWLRIGSFTIMTTSDFSRLSIIIFTAFFIDQNYKDINSPYILIKKLLPYLIITIGLIVWQPDLSTSIITSLIVFSLLYVAGLKNKIILTICSAGFGLFLIIISLFEYQQDRLINWFYGSNSQSSNSLLALANGGFLGKGIGNSIFKEYGHLPEVQTDFILSSIGEEVGFLGILIIFYLFIIFFYKGLNIARNCRSRFSMFLSIGLTINIFFYLLVNSAYVIGLLPTTGLPIPFISYGGSQTIFSLISVGILVSISRSNYKNSHIKYYYGT